jgi:hypothetical protein
VQSAARSDALQANGRLTAANTLTCPISRGTSIVGIQVSRGVRLRIPAGGIVIQSIDGCVPTMEVRAVELQLDVCVHWLEIAFDQLLAAEQAYCVTIKSARTQVDGEYDMDREFKCSLQAIVAAATFFEALYAAVKERDPLKQAAPRGSARRRTARFAIVTEQLRRCFGLRKQGTANLRGVLSEVYRCRDEAVHPSARFTQPVQHPDLPFSVERRFVMFSASSARQIVRAAIAFSKILPSRDLSRRPKGIQEFGAYLLQMSSPLHAAWEEKFGPLLDEV